jgi:hypothetical protein
MTALSRFTPEPSPSAEAAEAPKSHRKAKFAMRRIGADIQGPPFPKEI